MRKKNISEVLRTHKDFKKFVRELQAKKLQTEGKLIRSSRITLAMLNQYKKYPLLKKELEKADLK